MSFPVALVASLCAGALMPSAAMAAVAAECVWGNCQNGHGTLRHSDGRLERGIFEDGQLVKSLGGGRPPERAPEAARARPGDARHRAETPEMTPGARARGCVRGNCANGLGLRTYPNGSNYEGDFLNGLRHGRGSYTRADGSRYEGHWAADRRHGLGRQSYRDGYYEGRWYKGAPTREGVRVWQNGDRYRGDYRGDERHGRGTLTLGNGDRYEGEFSAGEPHGIGVWHHAGGRVREGRWSRGRYMGAAGSGPGRSPSRGLVAGGSGCVGGDCWGGKGRYVYADGRQYVGSFRSGQPHGRGSLMHPDGRVDSGTWENGARVGRRLMVTPSAVAKWRAEAQPPGGCLSGDCRTGRGSYRWSDGSSYVGDFQEARPDGQGTWTHPDGRRYVGGWRHGNRHGAGTETSADGAVRRGSWVAGRLRVGPASLSRARAALRRRLPWPDLSRPARRVGGGEGDAAVVVGIERYAHIAEITGASDNATYWYDYLVRTRGVPLANVGLLLDNDATLEDIEWSIDEATQQVSETGTLWFVFIGHGAPSRDGEDGLLIGFDAQEKARSMAVRSLRRSQLLARLAASRAAQIQVYLDTSFSGRATNGEQLVAGLQPLVVTAADATADPRTTLFTAARGDEYAGPLPGAERPAFSYLALGGIRGWADADLDGSVTAEELRSYVDRVLRLLDRDRRQRPTLSGASQTRLARSARERGPKLSSLALGLAKSSPTSAPR